MGGAPPQFQIQKHDSTTLSKFTLHKLDGFRFEHPAASAIQGSTCEAQEVLPMGDEVSAVKPFNPQNSQEGESAPRNQLPDSETLLEASMLLEHHPADQLDTDPSEYSLPGRWESTSSYEAEEFDEDYLADLFKAVEEGLGCSKDRVELDVGDQTSSFQSQFQADCNDSDFGSDPFTDQDAETLISISNTQPQSDSDGSEFGSDPFTSHDADFS